MVYEIQPKLDWDEGRAVLYLLETVELATDVLPPYVGDDINDEHAFRAIWGGGIGIPVADPADPELAWRSPSRSMFSDIRKRWRLSRALAR